MQHSAQQQNTAKLIVVLCRCRQHCHHKRWQGTTFMHRSERAPVSSLTTVDLPAPLGPTIATRELRLACSVTPATMARSVLG